MKILVSGGTGFIGKHLLRLLSNHKIDIISLIRNSDFNGLKKTQDSRIIEFNFSDIQSIEKEINWQEINFTINLATKYNPIEDKSFIVQSVDSNILFPNLLIKNCLKNDIPFITFGSYQQEIDTSAYNKSFYLHTKKSIHNTLENLAQVTNFKYIEIILNDTYGIGDNRNKILDLILKSFKGEALKTTPGDQLINLVNVLDVSQAVYFLIMELIKGNIAFNRTVGIRSKNYVSIKDLAKICEEVKGMPSNIEWGALKYRGNELFKEPHLSPILPNWREKITLSKGILELIEHNAY